MSMENDFMNWVCCQRRDEAYFRQREAEEYEERQNTPKRGLNRPETDFDLNNNQIPKGK